MPDQIQIRWSTWSGSNYDDSMAALKEFDPIPNVRAALSVKGSMPKEAIDRIMDIVNEFDADANIMLTATWGKDQAPNQLRLFGPNATPNARRRGRKAVQEPDPPAADDVEPPTEEDEEPPDPPATNMESWEYNQTDGNRAAENADIAEYSADGVVCG